jgi:DNA-binding IclR family transcriptional regulator
MGAEVLPQIYRDILEVVSDAPGPIRAKQIVPRIGLPAETGKIEGTRSKLKRLVERGWLDEDTPGMFTLARRRGGVSPNSR